MHNDVQIVILAAGKSTRMGGDDAERSVEEGADTPVWLATLPDDGPTGGLFGERQPIAW